MDDPTRWRDVDRYLVDTLIDEDEPLQRARADSHRADLPGMK